MPKQLAPRSVLALFFIQAVFVIHTTAGKCGRKPVDVVFVLDESGSIWGPHFKQQLRFVQDLVDGFDIAPNGTRVGVETFGDSVRTIIELGAAMNVEQLKKDIGKIQQLRGSTGTHLALLQLRKMFSGRYNRPGASRVAIVITDGESDKPDETAIEADAVHAEGIVVFAIGVGLAVKRAELERIASQPEYVFTVDNYDQLNSLLSILAVKACPVDELELTPSTKSWPEPLPATRDEGEWRPVHPSTTSSPATPRAPATMETVEQFTWATPKLFPFKPVAPKEIEGCDQSVSFNVYFGLPDQLSVLDTYHTLQFIRDITAILKMSPSYIRPTLCPRICATPYQPTESFEASNNLEFVAALEERGGESVTQHDLQLEYILKQEEGYRRRYPVDDLTLRATVAILMLDNRIAKMERLLRQVDLARRYGIKIVTIGVGDYVDRNELWRLASTERDLLYLHSYNQLPTIRDNVLQRVCIRGLVQSAGSDL